MIPTILGGGKTVMFGNIVSDQFLTVGDYPFGSALSAVFMAGITVILVALRSRTASFEDVV